MHGVLAAVGVANDGLELFFDGEVRRARLGEFVLYVDGGFACAIVTLTDVCWYS